MPATCELCGAWLPEHQTSCPRKGIHPSQWTYRTDPFEKYITHQENRTIWVIGANEECSSNMLSSDVELRVSRVL